MFSGSIVALITPFKQGELDLQSLENLLYWHLESGTEGLVLCGSTGEGMLLTLKERLQIFNLSQSIVGDKIPIIVGCSGISIESVKSLINETPKCASVLITPPPYIKPSQQGIVEFFTELHKYTDRNIIIYNNPARCSVNIDVNTALQLFELKRIVGMKDSNTDLTRLFDLRGKTEKSLLCGEDSMFPNYLIQGGDGIISVVGNILPHKTKEFCHSLGTAKFSQLAQEFVEFVNILNFASNPVPIKFALSLLKKCKNELRFPLFPSANARLEEYIFRGLDISEKKEPTISRKAHNI